MKGFIEVTYVGGNTKTIISTTDIKKIEEPSDSSFSHTYVRIFDLNNNYISIQESYDQIKELIKQAQ